MKMRIDNSGWQICAQVHDGLGESILWHPDESALYWIDFYGPKVHRLKWADVQVETWNLDLGETIGSLAFTDRGGLILAVDHGLYLLDTTTGATRYFADPKNGQRTLAYNDSKVDRSGRYWVGTYDLTEKEPNGVFYRLHGDGPAAVADSGFVICNGPAFSPDNRRLYFSDTCGYQILAYKMDDCGALSDRETFFTFRTDEGMPDGLTVDRDGNVWCALYGGGKIVCIGADGTLKLSLPLPVPLVTSLCFGGPELNILYVTTGKSGVVAGASELADLGGAVFMRQVEMIGLPERPASI